MCRKIVLVASTPMLVVCNMCVILTVSYYIVVSFTPLHVDEVLVVEVVDRRMRCLEDSGVGSRTMRCC